MARIAGFLRRHLIWLLLAAYAVACVAPGPGAAIAQSNLSEGLGGGGRVTAPLLMVAVLLFLASMAVELGELRVLLRRPGVWLASLVCVWVGPALAVALAAWLLPGLAGGPVGGPAGGPVAGLLLGMALVAAMPVANSSVAWTQQAGGSLPWSLGLVVVSILLTPLVTPPLLRLAGMSLAGGQGEFVEQIVSSFSGAPFVVWVLLPTLAGLAARRVLGADAVAELAPTRQVASAVILLVLNYANGAVALPQFFQHPTASVLLAAAAAAVALGLTGAVLASVIASTLQLDHPTGDALRFSLSMKHTGLAFALATTAGLAQQPEAMLLIVVTTPTQHLIAALLDRLASTRVERG